jgi:hypothetical protein
MRRLNLFFIVFFGIYGISTQAQFIKFYAGITQKTNSLLYQSDYIPYSAHTDIVQTSVNPTTGLSLLVLYQLNPRWKVGLSSNLDFFSVRLFTNSSVLEDSIYDYDYHNAYCLYNINSLSSEYLLLSRRSFAIGAKLSLNEHFPIGQRRELKNNLENPNLDALYQREFISGFRNFRSYEIGGWIEFLRGRLGLSFSYQRSFSPLFNPNYKYLRTYILGLRINFLNLDKEKIGLKARMDEALLVNKKRGFKVGIRISTVPFAKKETSGKLLSIGSDNEEIISQHGDLESSNYAGYFPIYPALYGEQFINRFLGLELGINWRGYNFIGNKTTIYADTIITHREQVNSGNLEHHLSLQASTIFKILGKNNYRINLITGVFGSLDLEEWQIQKNLFSLSGLEFRHKNLGLRVNYCRSLTDPLYKIISEYGDYTIKNFHSIEFSISYDLFKIKGFTHF